jgi:hypothetical protein
MLYFPYQQMHTVMYVLSILAQDEDTQRKGCVAIIMNIDPFRRPVDPVDHFRLANFMGNDGPVRYGACHFCVSQQSMISNPLLQSTLSVTSQNYTDLVVLLERDKVHW